VPFTVPPPLTRTKPQSSVAAPPLPLTISRVIPTHRKPLYSAPTSPRKITPFLPKPSPTCHHSLICAPSPVVSGRFCAALQSAALTLAQMFSYQRKLYHQSHSSVVGTVRMAPQSGMMLPVDSKGSDSGASLRRGPAYRPLSPGVFSPNHFRASMEHRRNGSRLEKSQSVSVDFVKRTADVKTSVSLPLSWNVIRPSTAPASPPNLGTHVVSTPCSRTARQPHPADTLVVKHGSGLAKNDLFVVASNPSKRSIVLQSPASGRLVQDSFQLPMSPVMRSRPSSAKAIRSRPTSAASQRPSETPVTPIHAVPITALRNLHLPVNQSAKHAAFLSDLLSPWGEK
jgi:hypothetical protein